MDPVGLARVGALRAPGCRARRASRLLSRSARRRPRRAARRCAIALWADRDDDDANGVPTASRRPAARRPTSTSFRSTSASSARVAAGGVGRRARARRPRQGRRRSLGARRSRARLAQGLSPGRVELRGQDAGRTAARDRRRARDRPARRRGRRGRHGALARVARAHAARMRIEGPPDAPYDDPDALRVVLDAPDDGPGLDGEREIAVESVERARRAHRRYRRTSRSRRPRARGPIRACAAGRARRCASSSTTSTATTPRRRAIHQGRGGRRHRAPRRRAQGADDPRARPAQLARSGPSGACGRRCARSSSASRPGGAPAIGGTEAGAVDALRAELASAAGIWGQCGLTFGEPATQEVRVVDPPPSHLVAIGDDLGIAASGGEIRLRADGKTLAVTTSRGRAARPRRLRPRARSPRRAGLVAVVSPNARIGPGLGAERRRLAAPEGRHARRGRAGPGRPRCPPIATLSVRIGSVDLSDGLQHFTDMDAMAGHARGAHAAQGHRRRRSDHHRGRRRPAVRRRRPHRRVVHRQRSLERAQRRPARSRRHSRAKEQPDPGARARPRPHGPARATPTTTASTRRPCSWTPTPPTRRLSARAASPSTSARASCVRPGPSARVPLLVDCARRAAAAGDETLGAVGYLPDGLLAVVTAG